MPTRFYFHSTTNSTVGLPTTEQSSLTATLSVDAQTLNRTMNTTIGTGMTSIGTTSASTSSRNLYYTRFVSQPIFQSSIAANTWTYNFSALQQHASANFPVNGSNQAVRVNCYVWRPSTSTKIGTILDGTTAATADENAANINAVKHTTFTGAAVAGTASNDVIIFEVWFIITSVTTTTLAKNFFYNGTTVNTTDNNTVSNHASFLETPETLALTGVAHFDRTAGESFTVSDAPPTKVYKARRTLPSNTVTISGNATRFLDVGRVASATLTVAAAPVKVFRRSISIPQSLSIAVNALGEKLFARSVGENFIIIADANRSGKLARTFPVSLTIAAAPVVTRRVLRSVGEILTVNAVVTRAKRFVRTAANSLTILDSVVRDFTGRRTVTEPITISAAVTKVSRIKKTVSNSLTVTANVTRAKRVLKTASNSLTIVGNVVPVRKMARTLSENLTVNAIGVRRLRAIRVITVPITIAIVLDAHIVALVERTANASLTISANVARLRRVPRLIVESISVATQAIEKLCSAYD